MKNKMKNSLIEIEKYVFKLTIQLQVLHKIIKFDGIL